MKEFLTSIIPAEVWTFAGVLVIAVIAFIFVKFNSKLLGLFAKLVQLFSNLLFKIVGTPLKSANKRLLRTAYLNKGSRIYRVVHYFEQLIFALELQKEGVSVSGLLFFLVSTSIILSFVLNSLFHFGLLLPVCTVAVFVIVFILFKILATTQVEKREEAIMDAVDILVADVKGGVFNAITRYENVFSYRVRPYFTQFIDAVRHQGYSFNDAMLDLNDKLGPVFSDFAYKAILYEDKADEGMDEIFSSIIEKNRNRRILRYNNNLVFKEVRTTFLVCCAVIAVFGLYLTATEPYFTEFFTTTGFGKLLIIIDIIIIAAVLAFISSVKAQRL